MADDDLDHNHEGSLGGEGFGVRKNIALKLKPSPKGKRGRKPKHKKEEVREEVRPSQGEYEEEVQLPILKGPPAPQHKNKKLNWDHKVHLIGEKVVDPLIHCCETCNLPILIYGRMIPCKHVFCLDCAKKADKSCTRCSDAVQRIEQAALGTVFMCTNGGAKHGVSGCRRTYLSNRDLQAHIHYRHQREPQPSQQQQTQQQPVPQPSQQQQAPPQQQQQQPVSIQQMAVPQSSTAPAMIVQRTDYPPPPLSSATAVSLAAAGGLAQQQIQQSSNPPMYSGNQIHQMPPNFSSPPPPQGGLPPPHAPPPGVQNPQGFHPQQPPPNSMDGYNNMGPAGLMEQQRTSTLISIPLQDEGRSFHPGIPPPGYIPNQAPGGPPPSGPYHPPVSFAGNIGAPPPQVMHRGPLAPPPQQHRGNAPPQLGGPGGHLRGGPPVSSHGGLPPRFAPGQNAPFSQSGPPPGMGGPRRWSPQGGGVIGPPPRQGGPSGGPPARY